MGNAVFPDLPGLKIEASRIPNFSTKIQAVASGNETRAAFMLYPLWTFRLAFEVLGHGLQGDDLNTLQGFFLARRGQFDSFLYLDPSDNAVADMSFGTGNGSATQFQLTRRCSSGFPFDEPVQNLKFLTNIKAAGSVTTAYSISGTGLVTFNSPPANGAALTWTGQFYYRCRFLQDMAEFEQFLQDLWSLKKLELLGSPMNKV